MREAIKLTGKIALITGGGGALGRAMALLFAQEGADIAVGDINLQSATETAAAIKQIGRKAIAIEADVSNVDNVDAMVERVMNELGGVHILVNNAGLSSAGGPTIEQSVALF